ncbi:hypothetical protein CH330_07615 [candidate division WOR-3 bacterium JGI_Cruoil_03_51_56]|uniref:FlgD/Vpr Ig-like domain-containing protein n=1 Tax=candidate division WOR-3 bacterium JGI_Cruoil_03_51_56 TaxID=1973747 RepID=A0A235BRX4_UNCW3|nr:MAG: hypothetical protein CH330_07615 [candidate division WOR-3 bacterium JGI_Cruoil_03_51_56]
MSGDYATITRGANTQAATTMGWHNAGHPIMAGVTTVGDYYAGGSQFVTTAESVARWNDGRPYVGVSANKKVVGVNQYPGIYSRTPPQRSGDWALVIHNALMFVAGAITGVNEFDPFAPALHLMLKTAPNPVMNRVVVNYAVPYSGKVNIGFYDLNGRLVKTLVSGQAKPGLNRAVWDMTDNHGQKVASGIYFCKLTAGDKTCARKLVVK